MDTNRWKTLEFKLLDTIDLCSLNRHVILITQHYLINNLRTKKDNLHCEFDLFTEYFKLLISFHWCCRRIHLSCLGRLHSNAVLGYIHFTVSNHQKKQNWKHMLYMSVYFAPFNTSNGFIPVTVALKKLSIQCKCLAKCKTFTLSDRVNL